MAERVLTTRALNRALLARQLLLERAELAPERAVERVGGLQTQYAPSGYVGLWSRLRGFDRSALTDALLDRRVVQGWVMRCTIHMVSARDYPLLTEAVRAPRREWWMRAWKPPADLDMAAYADAVRRFLADGPRKQADLQRLLVEDGFPREAWAGAQLWVDLVRVPPAGTWDTPRAHVYGLAEHWLPRPDPPPTAAAGQELLATPLPARVRPGVGQGRGLVLRVDDHGGARGARPPGAAPVPGRERRRAARPATRPAARRGHARRRCASCPPGTPCCSCTPGAPRSFRSATGRGSSPAPCRSRCRPSWSTGRSRAPGATVDGQVRVEPFEDLPPSVRREVDDEAERLTAFHAPSAAAGRQRAKGSR